MMISSKETFIRVTLLLVFLLFNGHLTFGKNTTFSFVECRIVEQSANKEILKLDKVIKDSQKGGAVYKIKTIVLDAGHGGKDPGCSGKKSKEKYITLAICKKIGNYLNANYSDIKVIYTRKKDIFIPLHTRANIANQNKADLFISIHCNSFSKQNTYGTETYVMGTTSSDENLDVAKRENEAILLEKNYVEQYGGYDPNSPEGHILLSFFMNTFLEQSINFASKIEERLSKTGERRSRGVKQAGFIVLKETTMPSVLIETGFLTNKTEEQYLLTNKGKDNIALSIFLAIQDYKNSVEIEERPIVKEISFLEEEDKVPTLIGNTYKIQLAESDTLLKTTSERWQCIDLYEVEQKEDRYHYFYGSFQSLKAAEKRKNELIRKGFTNATIVGLKNGQKITTSTE